MACPRFLLAAAFGAAIVALGLARASPSAERPAYLPAVTGEYQFPKDVGFTGNLSCAATACHGGADSRRPGGEYGAWIERDPHQRAYQTLHNDLSRQIVKRLHGTKPAHQDVRCLSCHAPTMVHAPAAPQGVGCESCHGPAEKYRTVHYQNDFKARTRAEKAEYGLYPTKDLAFRVTLCASCHVGETDREVNHDLIAAGHPRLAFEYAGYHHSRKYSRDVEWRHWEETAYGPDFDARAWEIGQVACAKSAAELLAARAVSRDRPWPELAEYSCFACHKDLNNEAWKPLTASDRRPGTLPWGTWYFSTLGSTVGDKSLSAEITDFRVRMTTPTADRAEIARGAKSLAKRLESRLRELQRAADADSRERPYDGPLLAGRFDSLARRALTDDGQKFRDLDWDGVTQHYLGAAALYYAWGTVDAAGRELRLRDPLAHLRGSLAYPPEYNSPKATDPERLLQQFRRLRSDNPDRARHP